MSLQFTKIFCRPTMMADFKAQPPLTEKTLPTSLPISHSYYQYICDTTLLNLLPEKTLNEENAVQSKICTHKKSHKILQKVHNMFFARHFSLFLERDIFV